MTVLEKPMARFSRYCQALALFCLGTLLAAVSTTSSNAQTIVVADMQGEQLQVIDMQGNMAVVIENGEPSVIADGSFSMVKAPAFTDGAIHIKSKDAYMGQDYRAARGGFFFRFVAEIKAERDFEDCFVLFAIAPDDGSETIILQEISDINAGDSERVNITFSVNPGFGGGGYKYFFFSKGEPIEVIDPNAERTIRTAGRQDGEEPPSPQPEPTKRRREALPPASAVEVTKTVYPNYPEELEGTGVSGAAKVIFTIGVDGRVIEIIDMAADHRAFLGEALKSVMQSEYTPAYYENKPLLSSVYQEFSFNEFVVFPGKVQMIPYPEIEDRDPVLVYSPKDVQEGLRGKCAVEVVVDRFGRASEFRVLESSSDELANQLRDQFEHWLFLPAIQEGFPIERRVRIPINFGESALSSQGGDSP